MTYYLLIALLIWLAIEFCKATKKQSTARFLPINGLHCILCFNASVTDNASLLWSTYEYSKDSMRGKSSIKPKHSCAGRPGPRSYAYGFGQVVGGHL